MKKTLLFILCFGALFISCSKLTLHKSESLEDEFVRRNPQFFFDPNYKYVHVHYNDLVHTRTFFSYNISTQSTVAEIQNKLTANLDSIYDVTESTENSITFQWVIDSQDTVALEWIECYFMIDTAEASITAYKINYLQKEASNADADKTQAKEYHQQYITGPIK